MATKYMKNILRFTNNERNTDKIMWYHPLFIGLAMLRVSLSMCEKLFVEIETATLGECNLLKCIKILECIPFDLVILILWLYPKKIIQCGQRYIYEDFPPSVAFYNHENWKIVSLNKNWLSTYWYIHPIFFLINLFIYLFLAAFGLHCCVQAFSSCGERGPLFVVVRRLLTAVASLVAVWGL